MMQTRENAKKYQNQRTLLRENMYKHIRPTSRSKKGRPDIPFCTKFCNEPDKT